MLGRRTSRILGGLSIASGAWLLCAPRSAGRVYGLPLQEPLLRLLGLRDVGVGMLLVRPATAALGCALRAGADLADVGLIAGEISRRPRAPGVSLLRLAGALSLVALSLETGRRLSDA